MSETMGTTAVAARVDPATVWQQFHARLYAFVRARVVSDQDAEDLVMDVFERIAQSAGAGAEITSVSGWVHRITRNAIVDYHRAKAREHRVAAQLGEGANEGSDDAAAPFDPSSALAQCLRPFVDHLPEPYAEAVLLVDFSGVSQVDAARRLGLSVSGMKSRVQRGRAKLRGLVLDCCDVELDQRRRVVGFEPRPVASRCGCDGDC